MLKHLYSAIIVMVLASAVWALDPLPISFDKLYLEQMPFWARPGDTVRVVREMYNFDGYAFMTPDSTAHSLRGLLDIPTEDSLCQIHLLIDTVYSPGAQSWIAGTLEPIYIAQMVGRLIISQTAEEGVHVLHGESNYRIGYGPNLPSFFVQHPFNIAIFVCNDSTKALDIQRQIIEADLRKFLNDRKGSSKKIEVYSTLPPGVQLTPNFPLTQGNMTIHLEPPPLNFLGFQKDGKDVFRIKADCSIFRWESADEVRYYRNNLEEYMAVRKGTEWETSLVRSLLIE